MHWKLIDYQKYIKNNKTLLSITGNATCLLSQKAHISGSSMLWNTQWAQSDLENIKWGSSFPKKLFFFTQLINMLISVCTLVFTHFLPSLHKAIIFCMLLTVNYHFYRIQTMAYDLLGELLTTLYAFTCFVCIAVYSPLGHNCCLVPSFFFVLFFLLLVEFSQM